MTQHAPDEPVPVEPEELVLGKDDLAQLMSAVVAKGRQFRFRARGWSMSPFIRDGDVLVLSPLSIADTLPGIVVAAVGPAGLLVHRIVAKTAAGYLLKGDNNRFTDGIVSKACLLAVVTSVERQGKRIFFGGGPERRLIATLSRYGFLRLVFFLPRCIRRCIAR